MNDNSKLLNVGCGPAFHQDWINIDKNPTRSDITPHDIRRGLPFPDGALEVVYHSHLLEHLDKEQGRILMEECVRVLRTGGVLRVVVPDLEEIASLYLEKLRLVSRGEGRKDDYEWSVLELYDQTVRTCTGGAMLDFMLSGRAENSNFVRSRIGDDLIGELDKFKNPKLNKRSIVDRILTKKPTYIVYRLAHLLRIKAAKLFVQAALGRTAADAFKESLFRDKGELHKWMYDQFSLASLMKAVGLKEVRACSVYESRINNFSEYGLDIVGGRARRPGSLYMEGTKA